MQLQTVKTTVELDPHLVYLAKMKALNEGKTLREIIAESLKQSLKVKLGTLTKSAKIGGYALGGIKGSLRRVNLYEDF
jgi:hypothetical protein